MGQNDRATAEAIVARLEVPPVVVPAYSFEMVGDDEGEASADTRALFHKETGQVRLLQGG